jgi:hypothetical protein
MTGELDRAPPPPIGACHHRAGVHADDRCAGARRQVAAHDHRRISSAAGDAAVGVVDEVLGRPEDAQQPVAD